MRLNKIKINKIVLKIGAANIDAFMQRGSAGELWVLLAGPTVNFICAMIFFVLYYFFCNLNLLVFSLVMFIFGAYNILPINNLDGGAILEWVLMKFLTVKTVNLILKIVSTFCSSVLFIFGVIVFLKNKENPTLILLSIYLFIGVLLKK